MKQAITPNGKRLIIVVLVVGLIAVILINTFGPAARQLEGMRIAGIYAEKKSKVIEGKEEFQHITISAGTASNGNVLVTGIIKKEDEQQLKDIIYTDELPREVGWKVRVVDEESWNYLTSSEQNKGSNQSQ